MRKHITTFSALLSIILMSLATDAGAASRKVRAAGQEVKETETATTVQEDPRVVYSKQDMQKFPDPIKYGPWVHNVTEDGFNILWVTKEKTLSWVEVCENDGSNFYSCERPRYYRTVSGRRMAGTFHSVHIGGLKPGTSYMYKISGNIISNETNPYRICYEGAYSAPAVYTVSTLDPTAGKCSFSMINDMHFDDAKYSSLIKGIKASDRDFLVLNGDIVSYAEKVDTMIKHSFEPIREISPYIPTVFARGNHEGRGPEWYLAPEVFPTPTGEFYYSFRQGPVAFLVLDAGEDKPDNDVEYSGTADYDSYRAAELEWLKQTVSDPSFKDAPIKICLMHIPTLDRKDAWYSQKWICDNFIPVLNEAGLDLMLSGHHHKYIFSAKGDGRNNYPVIANSNDERLDVKAEVRDGKRSLVVSTVDVNGKVTRTLTIL